MITESRKAEWRHRVDYLFQHATAMTTWELEFTDDIEKRLADGKETVDDYVERVENYCAAKGKRYKDKVAAAANWMKRDGVATLPGYGVKATPKLPACACGGKLKEYEPGSAMCENRDSEWTLRDGKWLEHSPTGEVI